MSRDDGKTISVPFCEACPALWDWPRKNLILGTCPRCGKLNEKAWRLAKAHRVVEHVTTGEADQ